MTKIYFNPNIFIQALIFCILAGCGSKPDTIVRYPPNILSEKEFTSVLVDFALAESVANLNIKNVSMQRMDTIYAFNPLKENHVSKAKYDSTLLFYANHADLYKKIYEKVLASLSEMQTKRDSTKKDVSPK